MRAAATLAATLALAGCVAPAARRPILPEQAEERPAPNGPAADTFVARQPLAALIAGEPELSRFRALAAAGGLNALIAGRGPVTVLAPTDAAFARLAPGTVKALLLPGNRPSLLHLLHFWVAPGALSADTLAARATTGAPVPTLEGEPLHVAGDPRETIAFVDADRRIARVAGKTGATDGDLILLDGIVAPRSIEPGVASTSDR
ncbi:fasciclin domain-containing protein [uncultured Sphingomonas sp.]|uniref:fasciclin domain-containing protein n=1 Tax=uncultured Sphingomonas sp. TaxID=158754 RepID=UPI0035C96E29